MGKTPCCEKTGLKKGKWTAEEDEKLINYIKANGDGSWRSLPKNAGLLRCGKSCRLRWINYLRADVKRGKFTADEEETIVKLHKNFGNKWSLIASHLPGRTDNEIKNYWNSHLSRTIYRFRSIGDSTLSAADMIKKAASTNKKRAAPVNANSHAAASRTTITPESGCGSTSAVAHKQATAEEPVGSEYLAGADVGSAERDLDPLGPSEGSIERKGAPPNGPVLSSCPSAFMVSSKEARVEETLRPLEEIDEDGLMHLRNFVEGDETDRSESFLINDGRDNVPVNTDSTATSEVRNLMSVSGRGVQCDCASSVNSFYDEAFYGDDNISVGPELNYLWGEEEDMLSWPWQYSCRHGL